VPDPRRADDRVPRRLRQRDPGAAPGGLRGAGRVPEEAREGALGKLRADRDPSQLLQRLLRGLALRLALGRAAPLRAPLAGPDQLDEERLLVIGARLLHDAVLG